jgi:CheY-like chemotaxis protein
MRHAPIYTSRRRYTRLPDDDSCIRKLQREALALEGYVIFGEAEHGQEALDSLRKAPCPLVVRIGQMMPVMKGTEMLAEVERDPRLARRHRFIMHSANYYVHSDPILRRMNVPFSAPSRHRGRSPASCRGIRRRPRVKMSPPIRTVTVDRPRECSESEHASRRRFGQAVGEGAAE